MRGEAPVLLIFFSQLTSFLKEITENRLGNAIRPFVISERLHIILGELMQPRKATEQ